MSPIPYKKAGVDIDKAEEFVKKIKPLIKRTDRQKSWERSEASAASLNPALEE